MSYLLTEIALEMLGYKFYDTNGVFHLTNFQQTSPQMDLHPEEKTLSALLLASQQAEQKTAAAATIPVSTVPATETADTSISNNVTRADETETDGTDLDATTLSSELTSTTVPCECEEAQNSIDAEIIKIKNEMRTRIRNNCRKSLTMLGGPVEGRIRDYLMREPNTMDDEERNLNDFLEFVEQRMFKQNQELYARYARSCSLPLRPTLKLPKKRNQPNDA